MKAWLIAAVLMALASNAAAATIIPDGTHRVHSSGFSLWLVGLPDVAFVLGDLSAMVSGDVVSIDGEVEGFATGNPYAFNLTASGLRIENGSRLYRHAGFLVGGSTFDGKDAFFSSPDPYRLEIGPTGSVFAWVADAAPGVGGGDFAAWLDVEQIPEPALSVLLALGLVTAWRRK